MSASSKNVNRVKPVLLYTLYSVLALLVVFIIMLAAFPDFMLNSFGFRTYIAHYDTMEPSIKENALVFIKKINLNDLEADELVTFQTHDDLNNDGKNDLITFYYDRTTGSGSDTYYYLKYDPEATMDAAVIQADSIVGGYAFSIPVLGLIIDFVASPFGIAVVLVNAAIITGIVFVVKTGNKDKKETNQKEN